MQTEGASLLEESTYFRTLSIDSFDPLPLLQTNQRKLVKTRNKHLQKKYASEVYSVEKCTGVLQGTYQEDLAEIGLSEASLTTQGRP